MAKKTSEKKSKRETDSAVKDFEKKAAKVLSKAEGLLASAKKAADDVTKSAKQAADDAAKAAEKAKKHAKKAKKSSKSPDARPGWDGVPAEKQSAAASDSSAPARQKTPSVSKDGASVTGAPPLPTPDDDATPGIGWTVARLRGVAKERGVSGYWSMSKERLVEALAVRK